MHRAISLSLGFAWAECLLRQLPSFFQAVREISTEGVLFSFQFKGFLRKETCI